MKHIAAALALAVVLIPAGAMVRGTTEAGRNFVSGGVGSEEIGTINQERSRYALSVLTAATGSGAFLSDIHIRITDDHATQVLETTMDGPWLLVDLPAGRYTIEATLNGLAKKTSLSLGNGEHRQATFYFDTHDEVEPAGTEHAAGGGG